MTETTASSPRVEIPLNARCRDCDYPLRGLPGRHCPECGRPFEREYPLTMNLGRKTPAWIRRIERPARWLKPTAIFAFFCAFFFAAYMPQVPLATALAPVSAYAIILLLYLPRLILRRIAVHGYQQSRALFDFDLALRRKIRRYFAVLALTCFINLPFVVCYTISRPFLDRLASHIFRDIPASEVPRTPRLCASS